MNASTTGVILAGGKSRRFGSDKALHIINGLSLIERAYNTLQQVTPQILISVASSETRYPLPAEHIVDKFPGAGPLAGMYTALYHAPSEWVIVLAVDLPFIKKEDLKSLLAARDASTDAVVATSNERIQPLAGCYRKRVAPTILRRLKKHQRAVIPWLEELTVRKIALEEKALENVNIPPEDT